jgi:Zn finger protein HypA/HybF involved in hydrogenase expression
MKRLSGALLTAAGVILILLGLLFLVGAGGQARRVVIGVVGLGLGGVAAGFGLRLVKQAAAASPEQVRAEILELARRRSGEIALTDVRAALGRRTDVAREVLEALVAEGACTRHARSGSEYFVFRDLQPRLMERYCEYCEAELPLNQELAKCPNCGGTLETRVASHSLGEGEAYHMDE